VSSRKPLLDEETRQHLAQLAAEAPTLSEHQEDVIARAFSGALEQQADDAS
jgi:hypothetical protein